MALQYTRVAETADALAALCVRTAKLLADLHRALEYNSDQAIDWGGGSTPPYIVEEANGNLKDRAYTRQAVSNAIGSLDWVRKLLTNQVMTGSQGDHLGNINQLVGPLS